VKEKPKTHGTERMDEWMVNYIIKVQGVLVWVADESLNSDLS